ncbi:hypothetical protein HY632_02605 [Candidatus Uhrbacteria bacterium]|nr:hypothetical protein [Candidatus Uhrbacteria bacterium]
MMDVALRAFPDQFSFIPTIVNGERLERRSGVVVAGMGGSALAPDLLRLRRPQQDLLVHRNYGLPDGAPDAWRARWCIASSYSGNTEETVDAMEHAQAAGMPVAVIAVGGVLLERAKAERMPYIQLPNTGIQPRSALGFSMIALSALLGDTEVVHELHAVGEQLDPLRAEQEGRALAGQLQGKIPLVLSSPRNASIGYNWKIKFNETGKIPAFANVFPELNHNEMTGFDAIASTRALTEQFHVLMIRDAADHPRIRRRMEVCAELYRERGIPVEMIELDDSSLWKRVFQSLLTADWAAYAIAMTNGAESEQVPMVEDFKQRMRQ